MRLENLSAGAAVCQCRHLAQRLCFTVTGALCTETLTQSAHGLAAAAEAGAPGTKDRKNKPEARLRAAARGR